jgi:gamma-glutamyltranspeptidase/glutathione hydrolase
MLSYGQQPQAACDAPRWKVNQGMTVDCEATMPAATVAALRERGHIIENIADAYMDFGSGQFIWRLSDDLEDGYVAASDSRRDGQASGF